MSGLGQAGGPYPARAGPLVAGGSAARIAAAITCHPLAEPIQTAFPARLAAAIVAAGGRAAGSAGRRAAGGAALAALRAAALPDAAHAAAERFAAFLAAILLTANRLGAARSRARLRAARSRAWRRTRSRASHLATNLHAHRIGHAHRYLLAHRARHVFRDLNRNAAVNRVGLLHTFGIGHLAADGVLFHRAHGLWHLPGLRGLNHVASLVRHLLDMVLHNVPAHRVGNLLDTLLLHHAAGGVALDGLDLGAILPDRAGLGAGMALALAIDIGALDAAGHGVGNLLLANFAHHALDRIRNLLVHHSTFLEVTAGAVAFIGIALLVTISSPGHVRDCIGDLLDNRVRHLLADRVRNLRVHNTLAIGGARNLFAHGVRPPHLAHALLRRALAAHLLAALLLAAALGLAGARIEAAFTAAIALIAARPMEMEQRATLAVGLFHPFAAALADRLVGGHRLAHGLAAVLVAGLRDILVARLAAALHAGLGDALGDLAADGLVAGLANRPAHRVAAFPHVLLTYVLLHLVAAHALVLFVDRLAHAVVAFLVVGFRHLVAGLVMAFFPAGLIHRLAAGDLDFFHDGLVARLAAFLHDLLVTGPVAGPVAGLAFFFPHGLAHRLHDGLLDSLVAGMKACFVDGIVHQLVGDPSLLLAGRKATLGIATRLAAAGEPAGAAIRGRRRLRSSPEAHQGDPQRRSHAHPHDFCLLIGTREMGPNPFQRNEISGFGSTVPVSQLGPRISSGVDPALPKKLRLRSWLGTRERPHLMQPWLSADI